MTRFFVALACAALYFVWVVLPIDARPNTVDLSDYGKFLQIP